MPGIGGFFGWNEPPPAAMITTFASTVSGVGSNAKFRCSGVPSDLQRLHHLAEVKGRMERLDLHHQIVDQPLRGHLRESRECRRSASPDRVRRIGRRSWQNVDQMRLDVEQSELEHREQPRRPGADDRDVGGNGLAHSAQPCLAGVVTTRPSSAGVDLDLAGKPRVRPHFEGEVEHVLLHLRRLADDRGPFRRRRRHGRSRRRRRRRIRPRCPARCCATPSPSPSNRSGRPPCATRRRRRCRSLWSSDWVDPFGRVRGARLHKARAAQRKSGMGFDRADAFSRAVRRSRRAPRPPPRPVRRSRERFRLPAAEGLLDGARRARDAAGADRQRRAAQFVRDVRADGRRRAARRQFGDQPGRLAVEKARAVQPRAPRRRRSVAPDERGRSVARNRPWRGSARAVNSGERAFLISKTLTRHVFHRIRHLLANAPTRPLNMVIETLTMF